MFFIKFYSCYLITNEVCVMSSQVLSMKAFSYVRLQAGIHWFNMLRGATQILRFTEEIGNYWFSNIAVDKWDGLSNQVVSAKTIESFKRPLDKYMDGDDSGNR